MPLHKLFRFICGVALLPLCWALGKVCVLVLLTTRAYAVCVTGGICGAVVFVMMKGYVGRCYVFLHELNHAVWSVIANSRVKKIVFGKQFGYVDVDKETVLGALAPYFFPIPLFLIVLGHGMLSLCHIRNPMVYYVEYGLLGFFIGWHVLTSLLIMYQEQFEITRIGLFFALSVIYALFLFWCGLFVSIISPDFCLADFVSVSYKEVTSIYTTIIHWIGSFL